MVEERTLAIGRHAFALCGIGGIPLIHVASQFEQIERAAILPVIAREMAALGGRIEQMLLVGHFARDESVLASERIEKQFGRPSAVLSARELVVAGFAEQFGNKSVGMTGAQIVVAGLSGATLSL